jgi:hypothetical protein
MGTKTTISVRQAGRRDSDSLVLVTCLVTQSGFAGESAFEIDNHAVRVVACDRCAIRSGLSSPVRRRLIQRVRVVRFLRTRGGRQAAGDEGDFVPGTQAGPVPVGLRVTEAEPVPMDPVNRGGGGLLTNFLSAGAVVVITVLTPSALAAAVATAAVAAVALLADQRWRS